MLLALIAYCEALHAQPSYSNVKAAFIMRIAEKIMWPKEYIGDSIYLQYYGNDSETFKALSLANGIIHGKPLAVSRINNLNKGVDGNILFIGKSKVSELVKANDAIVNKRILLITEDLDDAKYIMINLLHYEADKRITFEVNKANIIIEGLGIDPDLLLLGGTEVDVRELYRQAKKEYAIEQKKGEAYREQLKLQLIDIKEREKQIEEQNSAIQNLTDSTNALYFRIKSKEKELQRIERSVSRQKERIDKQRYEVVKQKRLIKSQTEVINERKHKLDSILLVSEKNMKIIDSQMKQLATNDAFIDFQQKSLNRLKILGAVLFLLVIWVSIAFIRNKRLNRELHISYKKIEESNELLSAQKDSISTLNKELEGSNGRLTKEREALKSTLDELRKTQNHLVQSEKMAALGVMVSGVAHEVMNPLNFVKSGQEVLRLNIGDIVEIIEKGEKLEKEYLDDLDEVLSHMHEGVVRIEEIVKSLNSFSRTKEGDLAEVDIHEVIDNCLVILRNEYKHSIEVVKEFGDIKGEIHANPGHMHQIFTNLLMNGIQAIENKGNIAITTEQIAKEVKIVFQDSGCGIPAENLEKVMDPFFTTKDPGEGTGLGLSIVYKLVHAANGKLEYKSKEGEWTKAIVTLPVS